MLKTIGFSTYIIAITIGIITIFVPHIDPTITALFYNNGFIYTNHPVAQFLYKSVPILAIILALFSLSALGYMSYKKISSFKGVSKRSVLLIFLVLLLGPGLGATLTKDTFGRARPHQTTLFGGDKNYTPPAVVTNQCEKNCSFVCGHATMAYSLIVLAFVVPTRLQAILFWSTFSFGTAVGLTRMVQGGHFFSDVVFAFIVDYSALLFVLYFINKKRSL